MQKAEVLVSSSTVPYNMAYFIMLFCLIYRYTVQPGTCTNNYVEYVNSRTLMYLLLYVDDIEITGVLPPFKRYRGMSFTI